MMLFMEEKQNLLKTANQLRRDVVTMIGSGNTGHLGGSVSLAELMAVLYFKKAKIDPASAKDPSRDRIILS
jgi:transketolase